MASKPSRTLKLTEDEALTLTERDDQLLISLAEHRILSMALMGGLHERNIVSLRRRIDLLRKAKLIHLTARTLRHEPGRPENLYSLAPAGINHLKQQGLLNRHVRCDSVTADTIPCVDHQLLTSVFRMHLVFMERGVNALSARFLAPTSPFTPRADNGEPMLQEKFTSSESPVREVDFLPDGVFALTHRELKKTLLFFLEVDMGTQTLVSAHHAKRDILQKILNYRALFQTGGYRRYENVFQSSLRGFRLLFLTTDSRRLSSLASLVRDNQPADFIWLTDRASLEADGAGASIWVRGGNETQPRQSILGSKASDDNGPVRKKG